MKTTAKIAAMLLVLALAGPVSARVITVEVTGVVDYVATDGGLALDGSVIVGSTMTGFCIYDTDTPDQYENDLRGLYEIDAISMTIGNYTFTHDLNSDSPILFSIGTIDYNYVVKTLSPRFDGTVTINGLSKTWDDINWSSSALTLLDVCSSSNELNLPDTLPESVPDISIFNWRRKFYVRFVADNGSSFYIYGEITSLTVVPAPFEVTPASVDFHYYLGGPNPEPQTLYVWAKEVDTLNWQITEDCNWLDVSPTTGQSSGEVDEVTLTVDISGLAPGSYHCQLTIFDPNVSEDYILHVPLNLFIGSKLFVPSQYLTIQAAIDAAENFDMVLVADGTYTGPGNRDIRFLGKAITVRSESGPENCIIDCQATEDDQHRGFKFHSDEGPNSVLEGFTITNGFGPGGPGGGIHCDNSSPTITNCTFSGNRADLGGGIYCDNSSPTITNCTFSGNSAEWAGGGIYCNDNSPTTITNCTITGNLAWIGGGIACNYNSPATITNCTITGNSAKWGAGILCYEGNTTIINCTITGNSAKWGGGIDCHNRSSPTIINSILWGNQAIYGPQICLEDNSNASVSYADVQGGPNDIYVEPGGILNWGTGNIDADPRFVGPGYWADANDPNIVVEPNDPNAIWIDGNYHLKSFGWRWDVQRKVWTWDDVTSRCIDAGNPGSPLGEELLSVPVDPNNEWGQNLRINMGAYGGTAEASMPPYDWALLADLTNDGTVNFEDYAAQAIDWLESESEQPGDVNRDGTVDIADIALLTEDWLKQTSWYTP